MSVRLTEDRIIIEVPSTAPAELYTSMTRDLLSAIQDAAAGGGGDYTQAMELALAMVADENTFAEHKPKRTKS